MSLTIQLPCFGIKLDILTSKGGRCGGTIEHDSDLKESCPVCSQPDCFFDCEMSQAEDSPESEEDARSRIEYNAAVDGITSMILAHAIAGIDVETPAYIEGIETSVQAAGDNL